MGGASSDVVRPDPRQSCRSSSRSRLPQQSPARTPAPTRSHARSWRGTRLFGRARFGVFTILYLNFKGASQSLIVMTGVPFAAVGAIWTLWLLHLNTPIAVWVGMMALLGVAAETASVMVVYVVWRTFQLRREARTRVEEEALHPGGPDHAHANAEWSRGCEAAQLAKRAA